MPQRCAVHILLQFSRLSIKMSGEGVRPSLDISPSRELHMGDCLVGSSTTKRLTFKNTSAVPITFNITLTGANYKFSPSQQGCKD